MLKKIILALVKTVRKTLLRAIAVGVKTIAVGERDWAQSTMNTTKRAGDVHLMSGVRGVSG